MPRAQLAARCECATPNLDIAHAIAQEFTTPIAASAIRFVEITPERCCVLYSEDGRVVWSVASDTFTVKIERGTQLDPAPVAYERPQPIPGALGTRSNGGHATVEMHGLYSSVDGSEVRSGLAKVISLAGFQLAETRRSRVPRTVVIGAFRSPPKW